MIAAVFPLQKNCTDKDNAYSQDGKAFAWPQRYTASAADTLRPGVYLRPGAYLRTGVHPLGAIH